MSTAASPSTVGHKAPGGNASSSSHVSRTHGAAAGASDAASVGTGFLAILGAVDDVAADSPLAGLAGAGALPLDASAGATVALPTPLPAPLPFDAATLLLQNPQIAAAQAQQTSDAGVATTAPTASAAACVPPLASQSLIPAGPLAAALAQPADAASVSVNAGLNASAAPLPAATEAPAAATPRGPQAVDALAKPVAATGVAVGSAAAEALALPESSTQGLQQVFARLRAGKDALQAGGGSGTPGTSTPDAGNATSASALANQWMASLEQAMAPTSSGTPEPALAPLFVKLEKPQAERERGGVDLKRADPTYAGTPLGTSLPDVSQSGAAAPTLAPEMQVAEQVSYWVSHNVQNAELSLDGLGQSPVQVSISLQGNEAQISFRTDEAAAREVLQNAGAHLKDMLQREGLVLTGVSVGHSGSGNADGGERRPRQNVRQTAIAPLQPSQAEVRPGLRAPSLGSAGRSVDLFV